VVQARMMDHEGNLSDHAQTVKIESPQIKSVWSWNTLKAKVTNKMNSWFNKSPIVNSIVKSADTEIDSSARSIASFEAAKVSMKKAVEQVKVLQVVKVATKGVPFKDENLILGRNNVPVFEFKKFKARVLALKIKKIPELNIGSEAVLDSDTLKEFVVEPLPLVKFTDIKALDSPELLSDLKFKQELGESVILAKDQVVIDIPILTEKEKVTSEKIDKLVYKLDSEFQVVEMPVNKLNEEELKMLRAMILFEKKDQCHIASGIFSDLTNSENYQVKESSRFYLGLCLHEMRLPSEALHYLLKIIRANDVRYTAAAIAASVEEIQLQHENDVAEAILSVKDVKLYPADKISDVHYLLAKYFIKKDQPEKALDHAQKVQPKNVHYYKAQYIASVAEYVVGKLDASLKRQNEIAAELIRKNTNKDILALIQVNTGRVAFQKGKYKDSLEAFRKVPKDHPVWMQALTEQAWAQLQYKDAAGAIGNMHSIHSPYFESVFKHESYVVRSIGYLNICQYADAYKSLAYLEHKYLPWLAKMEEYNKKSDLKKVYQTVATYLQGKSSMNVDNVPYQALREVARQRDFLNAQDSINQLIDEHGGYAFVKRLIEKDKINLLARRNATITKIAQIQQKIKKIKNTPSAPRQSEAWRFELTNLEDFLSIYEFKVLTLKESLTGIERLAPVAQERIAKSKNEIRVQAGKILKQNFTQLIRDLKKNLDNNELIKYEIYADSGENIRYQVAGGKVGGPSKLSESRKPTGMNWDFDGEFWEDEIGNYRSSLKNNCQANSAVQAKKE